MQRGTKIWVREKRGSGESKREPTYSDGHGMTSRMQDRVFFVRSTQPPWVPCFADDEDVLEARQAALEEAARQLELDDVPRSWTDFLKVST